MPTDAPRGVFIYYHGGGWVIGGNIDEFDTLGRKLAARTGCAVVLVDYRLAPEHRYPVAVDDSYAALEWVAAHLADIAGARRADHRRRRLGRRQPGGDHGPAQSRDRGGPPIAFQALVYPVTDADLDNASYTAEENQLMLSRDSMVWFWDHYLPDVGARDGDRRVAAAGRRTSPGCRRRSSSPPSTTCCATRARRTPTGCRRPASPSTATASPARCTASSRC